MENIMFEFRIIICTDGTEVIDRSLKTPYNALTPLQMLEYTEMDKQLSIMERLERKMNRETNRRRKLVKNPLYKIACLCGLF